jgi:hypothetical protein
MRSRTPAAVSVAAVAVLLAIPAAAQSTHYDVSLGYQWLNVGGNKDVQRSQTGLQDGPVLGGLSVVVGDTDKSLFFDRLQFDAAGFGGSPDGYFRLQLRRTLQYDLTINYRRAEVFSAFPDLANPFQSEGVVPGEHTLDRTREMLDLQLDLLPGGVITPIIGYSRETYTGPARTTYHVGEDEFRLNSDLDETVDEYRVGLRFAAGGFHGTVIQGWRKLDSVTHFTLTPGAGEGNSSTPLLGSDVTLDSLQRRASTSGTSPFTTAVVTGRVGDRVRLTGSYAHTDLRSDTEEDEALSGQLASFALRRFFGGLDDTVTGKAKSPVWHGELSADIEITSWLDLIASYAGSHRELSGSALLTYDYLDTSSFAGVNEGDLQVLTDAATAFKRDEDTGQVKLLARPLSWLRVWVAGSRINQDISVTPAAAEIVIPGGQGGSFSRDIDRTEAGAVATVGPVELRGDWSSDDADGTVLRTDYTDRDWWRVRGSLKLAPLLRFLASYESMDAKNPTTSVDFRYGYIRRAVDLELSKPGAPYSLTVGYSTYGNNTDLLIRQPQDFSVVAAPYLEKGKSLDGHLRWSFGRVVAEVGGNRFTNDGTFPLKLRRAFARVEVAEGKSISTVAEYEHRSYDETVRHLGDYRSDRYGIFVRYHN